ncbi:hypothetical protein MIND_00537600 [Mycena indigotica]|uniref:Uncharacterized protein n=1 Tax=Mycena indigotica TaxID=2126181 RepID=A0A8H6SZ42_9AGAR|nr:uncharacterized protein MIND_00537600 [Mycena indigotica]KAF7307432.1 hypothetical protein MIND_00537600 [Mycena indigotica]
MTRPRVPEKSHRGFVRVLAASPGPGLANYMGNPPPTVPRYRFGFITDAVILRGLTPKDLHYNAFGTENYIEAQLTECCAKHGHDNEKKFGVSRLADRGYDLKGNRLLNRVLVYFTSNMTEEALARTTNDALLSDVAKIAGMEKEDAAWLLQDWRV